MCDKSRNTWLCVHWQWNTLEWCQLNALQASPVVHLVTPLEWCQLNALQASPVVHLVTPLSCVSLSMNTQPSVPAIHSAVFSCLWPWFPTLWERFPIFLWCMYFWLSCREKNIVEEIKLIMGAHVEWSSPSWVCISQTIARDFFGIQTQVNSITHGPSWWILYVLTFDLELGWVTVQSFDANTCFVEWWESDEFRARSQTPSDESTGGVPIVLVDRTLVAATKNFQIFITAAQTQLQVTHNNTITLTSNKHQCLKVPATQLFVQQLVQNLWSLWVLMGIWCRT